MARTSALPDRPTITTRASVRSAIAATSGSSALRTATPPSAADGSDAGSSPLVSAIASREPNSPRCAVPTLRTTPIRGGAISASAAMWPRPRADISSTRNRVSASARSAVHGCPSSLLNDPGGATTDPSGDSTAASRSFVDVLPDDPVTPTTVSPDSVVSRSTLARASLPSAASTAAPDPSRSCSRASAPLPDVPSGSTTIAGTPTGRAASTATAPAATAPAAWSWPSTRAPGSARNRPPEVILRESNSTVPETVADGSSTSWSVPPTA